MKGSTAECVVVAFGEVYDTPIEETHDVNVKIIRTACPTCSKVQSGYYESVIQFRADNREIHSEEYKKADEILSDFSEKMIIRFFYRRKSPLPYASTAT